MYFMSPYTYFDLLTVVSFCLLKKMGWRLPPPDLKDFLSLFSQDMFLNSRCNGKD